MIDGILDTMGWNLYTYTKGNPIIYKDPTGHEVKQVFVPTRAGIGLHSYLQITPDKPQDFSKEEFNDIKKPEDRINKNNQRQKNTKKFTFLISGYGKTKEGEESAFNSNIVLESNWQGDLDNKKSDIKKIFTIKPPKGTSDTEFIKSIVKDFRKYRDKPFDKKFEYELLPDKGEKEYNCNSASHGLLKSSGASNIPSKNEIEKGLKFKLKAEGWNQPIDYKNLDKSQSDTKSSDSSLLYGDLAPY